MVKIRQTLRFFGIFAIIISFLIVNSMVWLVIRDRWRRTYIWSRFLTLAARSVLWAVGGKVNPIGIEQFHQEKSALLAGNHLSYMDVIMIASSLTTCFVTSVEIKETSGLGHLCMMAGCLFVERRSRSTLHKEIGELQEGLERGMTVTIFPEATSTNGEQVLRFRRPLFLSAVQGQKPVIPICINYRMIGNEPLSIHNRDSIFWYGDMDFLPHLWKLCGLGRLEADLHFLTPIQPKMGDDAGGIAALAQAAVEAAFQPVKSLAAGKD